MIKNFVNYTKDRKNTKQTYLFYCEKCNSLFSNIDNQEYVIDEEIEYKYDMFGALESKEKIEVYNILYRCPYCKWKYKEKI